MITLEQVASSFDSRYLNLFLLPTERCNFRCTYCYEDFAIGKMRPSVINAVKALLSRRFPELHTLEISWFGGEPLIAKEIIEDISLHITQQLSIRPVNYKANITTNGYHLDVPTAARLRELGITFYQISLDGPQAIHDKTRIKANGKGTFTTIWSNLLALRKSTLDIKLMLRVHFSPDTYASLDPLISAINHEFGDDERFVVFFKAVERLGSPNDSLIRTFGATEKREAKSYLVGQLARRSQLYDIAGDCETYICYASKPNSFVIRANGDVSKCTVGLYDERNRVGKLMPTGNIQLDQNKVRWWMRGFSSLTAEELTCPHGAEPVTAASIETVGAPS
jgi:uncharacterized protein